MERLQGLQDLHGGHEENTVRRPFIPFLSSLLPSFLFRILSFSHVLVSFYVVDSYFLSGIHVEKAKRIASFQCGFPTVKRKL